VAEEAGELQKMALQFWYESREGSVMVLAAKRKTIREEALQVAAMACRFLFYIEAYWPGESGRFED
jgi:hypothetical protein